MARINFDDEIFTDPRFHILADVCAGQEAALGMLSLFWFAAQRRWGQGELLRKTEFLKRWAPLLEAGFAEDREEGIYAVGSETKFAWYRQKIEAGKKGGRPEKETGEEPAHNRSVTGAKAGESGAKAQPTETKARETLLFPIPVPSSSSSSNKKCAKVRNRYAPSDFESIYAAYPRKLGKAAGLRFCVKKIQTPEDLEKLRQAVDCFAADAKKLGTEAQFIPYFSTFMGEEDRWRDFIPEADNPDPAPTRESMVRIEKELSPGEFDATAVPLSRLPLYEAKGWIRAKEAPA